MEHTAPAAYGLWSLVIINSLVFIIFAFSFAKPQSARDWRSFGAFSGFIVALFAEMYGYPLTIYLLSGWLTSRFPGVDFLSHDAGHLLEIMFGWRVNPHFGPFHVLSYVFIGGGFWLLSAAWSVLYRNQRSGTLAASGPYARMRHPQYAAFVLIMFGFLLQWPTILTLAMFPVLCFMYVRLAISEEKEAERTFGAEWARYAARTPRFVPRLQVRQGSLHSAVLIAGIATAMVLAALPSTAAAQAATLSSTAGGVTIKVTPKTPAQTAGLLEFDVAFDTHSTDLRDDVAQMAVLKLDDGRTLKASRWTGAPPGGHHRAGVLAFEVPPPKPVSFELHITRPGESAPRIFRWKL